ncbi:hypothetical protein FB45DRAFT_893569 [Roridomyces roridus]|uniref:Uncharacterized protein n=1 Tax=Roridomyces roridus TaxID=1738132 RepID=A0AAD7CFI4_9AGAR|nr:hypothetical protein FB45DRAFT_893569 [Roridomyces roridus]
MSTGLSQVSAIRRKPIHTNQSPSATGPAHPVKTTSQASTSKTSNNNIIVRADITPKQYPVAPSLPLYHPLGKLALSLPPLEPSMFGHSPRVNIDDSGRRSSGRSRRPAAKLRDAEEDEGSRPMVISNVSAIAAVAAREIKEKVVVVTPRKRRGGGPKRKRKEDDGDFSGAYPATKRTTRARGTTQVADEGSPSSETAPLPESSAPAEGEPQQERRTTRAWMKRRDSSASETSSGPGTVPNGTREEGEVSEEVPP